MNSIIIADISICILGGIVSN